MKRATPIAILSCQNFAKNASRIKSAIESNVENGNIPTDWESEYALYVAMSRIVAVSTFDLKDLANITEEVEHNALCGAVYLAKHFDKIVERFHIQDKWREVPWVMADTAVEMMDWGDYPADWFEGSAGA